MTGAMAFAFGAGLLATVNPCGFVMLPSFLTIALGMAQGVADRPLVSRGAHGLAVGLVLSGAFSAVLVLAGLALSAGLRSLVDAVPWLAVGVGIALAIAGVAMLAGRHLGLTGVERLRLGRATTDGYGRVALFGFGYAIASLSCTVAVVLAVATRATATANPLQVLAVFGAFAAGATSALLALSLSVALAKSVVARGMRRVAPAMNAIAGVMLLVSGAYLVVYWSPTILGDDTSGGGAVGDATERVSSAVANFLSAHTGKFAIGLAITAALATAYALMVRSSLPTSLGSDRVRRGGAPANYPPSAETPATGTSAAATAQAPHE